MKAILAELLASNVVTIGNRFKIYEMEGTLTVREERTGLMGPTVRATLSGLRALLRYLDTEIVRSPAV